MLVQILPDTMTKFAQMGDATIYEPAGDQPQAERRRVPYQSRSLAECITNVSTPTGKRPILKTMLTTIVHRSCELLSQGIGTFSGQSRSNCHHTIATLHRPFPA